MDAYILVGGEGTRLRSRLSGDLPKPMAPVSGIPFLEYPLQLLLRSQRIARIVFCARYGLTHIYRHFGNQYRGMPILYHVESQMSGTGGALASAMRLSRKNDICLAMNGDCLWNIDIDDYIDAFETSGAEAALALAKVDDAGRFGAVSIHPSTHFITAFEEKSKSGPAYINAGLYILPQRFFSARGIDADACFSLEKKIFAPLDATLYGHVYSGEFIDIGIPGDYDKAQSLAPSIMRLNSAEAIDDVPDIAGKK